MPADFAESLKQAGYPQSVFATSQDGKVGIIPQDQAEAATQHGYTIHEPAVYMTDPDGKLGLVPKSHAQAAVSRGYKVGQPTPKTDADASGPLRTVGREATLGASEGGGLPQTTEASDFSLLPGLKQIATHPVESAKLIGGGIAKTQGEALRQGAEEINQGVDTPGLGLKDRAVLTGGGLLHTAAGLTPMVGPALVDAGGEIGTGIQKGDVGEAAHGIGKGIGIAATLALAKHPEVADAAIEKVGGGVSDLAQSGLQRAGTLVKAGADKLKMAANPARALDILSPEELATKAVKPRNSVNAWQDKVASALPDARRAADAMGLKVGNLDDALTAVTQAKKDVWSEYSDLIGPNAKKAVDLSPVADAMERTITKRFEMQNPEAAAKIRDTAQMYRGRTMPLSDVEDFIQSANNELASFYGKYKLGQRVAARDPVMGSTVAEANTLRSILNDKLESLTGSDASAIKQRYGALTTFEDVLTRRMNVADRQAPNSLIEQMGKLDAAKDIGRGAFKAVTGRPLAGAADVVGAVQGLRAARAARTANDSNTLIGKAFEKSSASSPAPISGEYMPDPAEAVPPMQATRKQLPAPDRLQGVPEQPMVDAVANNSPSSSVTPLGATGRDGTLVRLAGALPAPAPPVVKPTPPQLPPISLGGNGSTGNTGNMEAVGMPEGAETSAIQRYQLAHQPTATEVSQSNTINEAVQAMQQANAMGQPQQPPPLPPPITPEAVSQAAEGIRQLPPEAQSAAVLKSHQSLSEGLAHQGAAIIDGKVEPIKSPDHAREVAAKVINSEIQKEGAVAKGDAVQLPSGESGTVVKVPAKNGKRVQVQTGDGRVTWKQADELKPADRARQSLAAAGMEDLNVKRGVPAESYQEDGAPEPLHYFNAPATGTTFGRFSSELKTPEDVLNIVRAKYAAENQSIPPELQATLDAFTPEEVAAISSQPTDNELSSEGTRGNAKTEPQPREIPSTSSTVQGENIGSVRQAKGQRDGNRSGGGASAGESTTRVHQEIASLDSQITDAEAKIKQMEGDATRPHSYVLAKRTLSKLIEQRDVAIATSHRLQKLLGKGVAK